MEKTWDRSRDLVIFDELHKMNNWKSWLKGIYDTERIPPSIIVTGSAKLDAYKKVGDSLAGRFFEFRLHPLDLKEIKTVLGPEDLAGKLDRLLKLGGFPEPYLEGDETYYNRWKRSHLDIILKQDLVDLENLRHITSIETLIQLLKKKVGSPNFSFFEKYLAGVNKIQIVKDLKREKTYPDGTKIRAAKNWLSEISLE